MSSLPNLTHEQKLDYLKRGVRAGQPAVEQLVNSSITMTSIAQLIVSHSERIMGAGSMVDESSAASVQRFTEKIVTTFSELTSQICDKLKDTIEKNNEVMENYGKEMIALGEEAKTASTQQLPPVVSQSLFTERQIDAVMQQLTILQNLSELESMAPGNNLRDRLRNLKT